MDDKRLTMRLMNYWKRLGKDELPDFAKLNTAAIDDLWQSCMVVVPLPRSSNTRTQTTLKLHHMGRKLSEVMGNAAVGSYVMARARQFSGDKILERMDELIATARPIEESGQFISDKHKVVKYRSCMLPFGNAKDGVTHVVVGLSWREF